jgi:sugar/nucleoside kinase (ribokinase family)
VAASRLGARCAYAGVLGHDELSQFVETTLRRENIDVSQIVRREDASPVHSRIVVDASSGARNIFYEVKGMAGADERLPDESVIRAARVLFVDPWGEVGQLRAAKIAREACIPIVADIERSDFENFERLFALVDHLIVSQDFALRQTGASTPAQAARTLWQETRHTVIVTEGAKGCHCISREYSEECSNREPQHHAAFKVEVVDTTGCGDVFHGAYAATLAQGLEIDERVRLASAAAALKAGQPGGQQGIPSRAAVEEFLRAVPQLYEAELN